MELTLDRLAAILSEAYDSGYAGDDDRDEAVAQLLSRHNINEADDKPPPVVDVKDADFRIYSAAELRDMPVGAAFIHEALGKCRVQMKRRKEGDEKCMAFDNPGLQPAGFNVNGYPWDMPMKRIG